ncbi:TPA: hypothetical protein NKZ56_003294 [Vibrio parahaemolyticus]|nr:hypothetical protein [Vibrio parahaemolyticus]HCH5603816.1 hypothetical protein [Vibrio parahaemolyticus]
MAGNLNPNGRTQRINGLSGWPNIKPISTMLPIAGGSSLPAYSPTPGNGYGLSGYSLMEVETNEAIYLVDKDTRNAVSGKYLIDIDGNLSINQIQRLPGKKLAIAFGDTTMEVFDSDIKVMGRVAVTSKKE